jgi:putative transcriptional regulator
MSSHAGSFLVARTSLQDPSFRRSVVLLIKHGKEGAFGLVVNRPAPVEGLPFNLFAGGPCESEGLLMLHGHPQWAAASVEPPNLEIAPGVFLGDATCMERVKAAGPEADLRYRVFLGYAGWGPSQLEGELEEGAWAVLPASGDLLFDTPPEELWDCLAPPRIPEPSAN